MISEAFIPIFCLLAFVFRQIGSDFGYFPKDLLEINHNYTNEELELPTEETDFVCFQDGRDDFDNYNVYDLLKSS